MIRVKTTTEIAHGVPMNRTSASLGRGTNPANPTNPKKPTHPRSMRARGRRGESLTSARDRKRLHERNLAERARVEGMLANVAAPIERRNHRREWVKEEPAFLARQTWLRQVEPLGCPVCGDDRIVTDEVMHGGTLRMSECLHCDHRWTDRPKAQWVELGARMNRDERPRALQIVER
jgi:hypothetical protein